MKWAPGRNSLGNVPMHDDGHPVFAVSDCNQYVVSRAYTLRGYLSDAWLKQKDEKGRWSLPIQLAGGVTAAKAKRICEDHANGIHP